MAGGWEGRGIFVDSARKEASNGRFFAQDLTEQKSPGPPSPDSHEGDVVSRFMDLPAHMKLRWQSSPHKRIVTTVLSAPAVNSSCPRQPSRVWRTSGGTFVDSARKEASNGRFFAQDLTEQKSPGPPSPDSHEGDVVSRFMDLPAHMKLRWQSSPHKRIVTTVLSAPAVNSSCPRQPSRVWRTSGGTRLTHEANPVLKTPVRSENG